MAESWQDRKKTRRTRKAAAEALAAANMRMVARARAFGVLARVSEETLERVRAAGKPLVADQKSAVRAASGVKSGKRSKVSLSRRAALLKAKRTGGNRDEQTRKALEKRDAEYREALGLNAGAALPAKLGQATSAGAGRDRAKTARLAGRGDRVRLAGRAKHIS